MGILPIICARSLGGAWHMSADACAWGSAHTLSRRLLGLAGRLFSGWESVTRIRWNSVEDAAPIVTQTIHHSELVGQTENLIKKIEQRQRSPHNNLNSIYLLL